MELIESGSGLTFFGKSNLILWGLNLGIPALLATLYWGGLMVGRLAVDMDDCCGMRIGDALLCTDRVARQGSGVHGLKRER